MNYIPKPTYIKTEEYVYNGKSLGLIKHGYGELKQGNMRIKGLWFFDVMHGEQEIYINDICIFTGTYVNGLKHGKGIEYIGKIKYIGTWSNDLKHGQFIIEYEKFTENVTYSNNIIIPLISNM